jgi:branched-chain amino acid transport system permease protein
MNRFRASFQSGLLTGLITVFIVLLGLNGLIGEIVSGWFSLPSSTPGAWLVLLVVAWWGGSRSERQEGGGSWLEASMAGLGAGVSGGLLLGAFLSVVAALIGAGVDVRKWLVQLSPEAVSLLTLGLRPAVAGLFTLGAISGASVAGALVSHASATQKWGESLSRRRGLLGERLLTVPAVQRFLGLKYAQHITIGLVLAIVLVAPFFLGQYWNYTLGTVGIYVVLGLGLNIVVGMAGLLSLGYVAFFAIGAYTVAVLASPQYPFMWSFWVALPIGTVLAAVTGLLLAVPVLRMRGDYLAIVTLGFGEIIRILAKSDALSEYTGGPRGIRAIGGPTLFGAKVNSEFHFMYIILLGIVAAVFITARLQRSRLGRALNAMREDEDVAQAVGIHTLKYKLTAFAIGAAFAGFGGVVFASRNKFTGPEDFALLVSINVLCLVIIGGMGSIPGVVVGSLVLKGLPEMLRQLDDYRMLAFGALLVIMMVLRPEGLWPSDRSSRSREATGGDVRELEPERAMGA